LNLPFQEQLLFFANLVEKDIILIGKEVNNFSCQIRNWFASKGCGEKSLNKYIPLCVNN
jgi:hypothetical protein